MEYRQGVPIFTPSGLGMITDLKNIKIAEMISWGGYKGEFVPLYEKIAGTEMKDYIDADGNTSTHKVFKYVDIDDYASQPDSDVYRFLEMLGIDKEGFEELSDAWNDNDLSIFQVRWDAIGSVTEDAWMIWIDYVADVLSKISKIVIKGSLMTYNTNDYSLNEMIPKYTNQWGINYSSVDGSHRKCEDIDPIEKKYIKTPPAGGNEPKSIFANPKMLVETMNVELFAGATNVSSSLSEPFKDMILSFILLEGSNSGIVNTSQSFTRVDSGEMKQVHQIEEFSVNFNKSYIQGLFDQYVRESTNDDGDIIYEVGGHVDCFSNEGATGFQYFETYNMNAWMAC